MGGVQSGTHNLGEALWVQERQRQKCHREGSRYGDSHSAQSTQDRRKLLKRTRSLAVISEDDSRQDREAAHFRLGQSTFDLPRRHQLIPRAKLIDRNSLKDRLSKSQQHLSDSYERFNEAKSYHSRSTCGLHSISSGLESLPDPLSYTRKNRIDPDRLNILDWPDPPRRYRSVQNLDTVSGLVDIVEDNCPIEGNRSIDCIYTQVKRKRKEHRSLDSILFEDDGELEYFDVLNLLPLSNIRLEYNETDLSRDGNFACKKIHDLRDLRVLEYNEPNGTSEVSPTRSSNATDEEKCKEHEVNEDNLARGDDESEKELREDLDSQGTFTRTDSNRRQYRETNGSFGADSEINSVNQFADQYSPSSSKTDHRGTDVENFVIFCEKEDQKIEEIEDYKSIWIPDENLNKMSRRPQVLKVVDNDVTRRRHRRSVVEIEAIVEDVPKDKRSQEITEEANERLNASIITSINNVNDEDEGHERKAKEVTTPENAENGVMVDDARNFLERKSTEKETARNKQNEGRFERIVKETSNILGKACSVVKGSLGFEARSESSDLGLGSESGSDSRRRSMDDGIEDDRPSRKVENSTNSATLRTDDNKKSRTNLTRSRSCVDSIECQDDGPEFDHVRYKIVKSHMFSKNMFNTTRGDVTYEGLMQYLREYSFQELLMDNNVVIIEPVRAETIERKSSPLARTEPKCKIAGAIQKKMENHERNGEQSESGGTAKSSRQSSIRKHFFYQPIRVNRELIDEELPDPDTVRNVRRMFENTLEKKKISDAEFSRDDKTRRSVSMKDLTSIDDNRYDEISDKTREESRSRCSSRAKDLTRLFETKSASSTISVAKEEIGSPRCESKTRILAQSFEARSGNTSPSGSNCSKNKVGRYHHHHHHHHQNWDSGSVSSGVSSDYPDTDPGSGAHCTSSDDEDVNCNYDDADASGPGHYVSQDVLRKIRECGTSVTYYGGKVVNMYNGPLVSPLIGNGFKQIDKSNDYVKFKLVKSNSCDSRLELAGRFVEGQSLRRNRDRCADLRQCTIAETPSIEITPIDSRQKDEIQKDEDVEQIKQMKREPPVVIGLEPKKEDSKDSRKIFKADFKLGDLNDSRSNYPSRFMPSALTRWEVNSSWKVGNDFGKMEFEEFEVLEDSLNGISEQNTYAQAS
ncbi:uncharacterized protein jv [Mycetomoellerius zeteki]|uniref:uncharacterized protein jv n=1 Tax=Mycetomoellerius zeteki TaxID=64791 RepID=UPI00084EC7BE|nr:PREDICTED: uncharacterized protein LOC108723802 [Trachymyrmex zeteki]